jgi:hypothetical protein
MHKVGLRKKSGEQYHSQYIQKNLKYLAINLMKGVTYLHNEKYNENYK